MIADRSAADGRTPREGDTRPGARRAPDYVLIAVVI